MTLKPVASDECMALASAVEIQRHCAETGGSTICWKTTKNNLYI